MNKNNILEFLEKYKELDQLCRQILSSDRGISEYIDEMSRESQGNRIAGWDRDYKKLKRLRWIRNRLVHEPDSFEDNLVNAEDIEWLHTFYKRIMECKDPFSLLRQSERLSRKEIDSHQNNKDLTNEVLTNKDLTDKELTSLKWLFAVIIAGGVIMMGIVVLYLYLLRL